MIDESTRHRSDVLPDNVAPPADQATQDTVVVEALHGDYAFMLRELRSWGLWQTGLGAVHLVAGGVLSAPWGILLLAVGLMSFRFRTAAMFVIYPTTFLWAAFSNISSGTTAWVGFGLLQVYFSYRIARHFPRFLRAQRAVQAVVGRDRARDVFPLAAAGLGTLALVALIVSFVLLLGNLNKLAPESANLVVDTAVNLGVLGIALSLSSILTGFGHKGASIYGLITSGLASLVWVVLLVMSMTG